MDQRNVESSEWPWACPRCRTGLVVTGDDRLRCPEDGATYERIEGIWRFLTPEQQAHYGRFVEEYDVVRHAEEWGSDQAAYYRALPYRDLSGRHEHIWRLRAISYDSLLEEVLHPAVQDRGRRLRIVDAGAGNCWLAYRLAQEGHQVLATDLRTDANDGLGAHVWYGADARFVPAQAAFETIPLEASTVDLVIFAGSLHYATDYETTLREAKRVLAHEGRIVVMETPVYRRARSGEQMVSELRHRLRQEHGIGADALKHENYLTLPRLHELGNRLALSWRVIEPFYGWRRALAPWLAKLRGRREPARFYLLVAKRRDMT